MTIDNVLHKLWTNSITSGPKLDKREEKRLWMILQQFVERKGGTREPASDYDVSAVRSGQSGRTT
jgi:hypothetical protein